MAPIPELPPALSGDRLETTGRAGRVSYYVAGQGTPMLLVHSINAVASAVEMRPLYERMKATHRVYALDLPGFGFSDRSKRDYVIRLYCDALLDLVDVIGQDFPDTPIDAVALSLSSEFLARVALERSGRFRTLTFITPTGLDRRSDSLREPGKNREIAGFSPIFEFPLWRQGLFNLLSKKGSIRYFLKRTYGGPKVDEDMVEYDYLSGRQPGAANAPFSFLSGRLFSRDARLLYEELTVPVWVPHGTRGDFKDFTGTDWTRERVNWTVQPFESGALVHYELPEEFFASFDAFLKT